MAKSESEQLYESMVKNYNDDSIVTKGAQHKDLGRLPTGIFPFDLATGGGWPKGKFSVLYGMESSLKTSICYKSIAMSQKQNPDMKQVFVDLENSYDPVWATKMGVDNDKVWVLFPNNAEQAVDMIDSYTYANDIDVVIVDSLAAMIPDNEVESSAEKAIVGGSAKLIASLVRKLTQALNKARKEGRSPTVILINQIRYKIGSYGDPECLHFDSMVNFVDGRSLPIGQVVEEEIYGDVWGFDIENDKPIPVPIASHHINGRAKDGDFFTIKTEGFDTKNGVMSTTATYTHKFLSNGVWLELRDLKVGDTVASKYKDNLNGTLADFLTGAFCGDVTICSNKGQNNTYLKFQDSIDKDYLQWKYGLLEDHLGGGLKGNKYSTGSSYAMTIFSERYQGRDPKRLMDNFSWLAMAIWIMDDGYYDNTDGHSRYMLSVKRLKATMSQLTRLQEFFNSMGLDCSMHKSGRIDFTAGATDKIAQEIAAYVPKCMSRKLPKGYEAKGDNLGLYSTEDYSSIDVKVLSIEPASKRKYRNRKLYDIHVGGDNAYMVGNKDNGFVTHNTMPGGKSIYFASSMTVRLNAKGEVDKKVHPTLEVWKTVTGVVKKYKAAVTQRNFEFKMSVFDQPNYPVGRVNDVTMLFKYLKQYDLLVQHEKGWKLLGKVYKKQEGIKKRLRNDTEFYNLVTDTIRQKVVEEYSTAPEIEDDDYGYVDDDPEPTKASKPVAKNTKVKVEYT